MHCTVVLFCVIVFFGYFLFSLFLFLHGLYPLGRVYRSFSILFFFITKIERNFTLYMLKKKKVYLFLFLSNTLNLQSI